MAPRRYIKMMDIVKIAKIKYIRIYKYAITAISWNRKKLIIINTTSRSKIHVFNFDCLKSTKEFARESRDPWWHENHVKRIKTYLWFERTNSIY